MQKLLIALFLLILQVQYLLCGSSFVSKSFDQLDPNLSLAYVNDYLTAVVWNNVAEEYNLQTTMDVTNILKQQHALKIAYIPANTKMGELWTSVSSNFVKNKGMVNFYAFVRGNCQRYHILEDFDMIITSRNLFLEKFRMYQKGSGKRTAVGHLFETSDFTFINLHPFTVYQVDESTTGLNMSVSVIKPTCESTLVTFDYEPALLNSFQIMNLTEGNTASDFDMECLKKWNPFAIKILTRTNQQVIRNEIMSTFGFDYNSTLSQLEALYLPSSCHNCNNEYCSDVIFNDFEYWLIPQTLVVVIHFLFLFFTGALKQPSVKRRIFTPYLPLSILYIELAISDLFWPICNQFLTSIGVLFNFCILVHLFTYIRLYYLRNLYSVFSLSKKINPRLISLTGIIPGMLFTTMIPFILCFIVSVPYISIYFMVNLAPNLVFNINLGISIGVACIIGFLVILVDLILNRKKWREKGLRYMLFFDDPFMVRIDMILLTINIVFIILIASVGAVYRHASYFFRLMAFIVFCLVGGGSCTIKIIIDKMRGSTLTTSDEDVLENYLKQDDFKKLLREYCVKELSLENYNFYMELTDMKSKANKRLTIEMMDQVEKEYISSLASFELNISSSCRKEFVSLRKNLDEQQTQTNMELSSKDGASDSGEATITCLKVQDLIIIFECEILANLKDTFSRMKQTYEFNTWLHAFKIQKQNNIC